MKAMKGISTLTAVLVLAAAVVSATLIVTYKRHIKPGSVVVVIGTSSSGKTSLINELQKLSGNSYEIVSIDVFYRSYTASHTRPKPRELLALDEKTKKQVIEKYQQAFVNEFYSSARNKALGGHNVIVDTVPLLQNDKGYDRLSMILKDVKTTKVLLYCPLDITIAHVEKRNLSGIPEEHREPIVTTIPQYEMLYKPQESPAEHVLDTISSKAIKQLIQSTIDSFMKNLPKDLKETEAKKITGDIYKEFVQHFKLDEQATIAVVPQKSYDLILDCKRTTEELAKTIKEHV